jgi:histidinol-phosphate phosphatase family protein
MRNAVFLDRDGVINEKVEDLVEPGLLRLIDGAAEAIRRMNDNGFLAVVVTNQPIISKGFCSIEDMERIHERMKMLLSAEGAKVDAIYLCPHYPVGGFRGERPELKFDCECRKPKPGLLLQAARDLGIDLGRSWLIGDCETDIMAAHRAGIRAIIVGGGCEGTKADYAVKTIKDAADIIIKTRQYGGNNHSLYPLNSKGYTP